MLARKVPKAGWGELWGHGRAHAPPAFPGDYRISIITVPQNNYQAL